MNKTFKIILNILIFALIAGFGYYMFHSMTAHETNADTKLEDDATTRVFLYKKINSFDAASKVQCFDLHNNSVYVALTDKISVFDLSGNHQRDFAIKTGVRDIVVSGRDVACNVSTTIYLLYPARIDLYSFEGEKLYEWEACSDNSDYCAFTTTKDYVFVTDAENKNIVQYDKQGHLVRFIKSPDGFIIPSYAFDIICINDTIYCSNSGRHRIESYTLNGEFIASFGISGAQAGAFAGCCNPVYLAKNYDGNILTSEKGNPRISSYDRNGKFRSILFDSNMLGGGTEAYRMKVSGEKIYIAGKKTISVYGFDKMSAEKSCKKSCNECKKECLVR
jgi:hypothetical protein